MNPQTASRAAPFALLTLLVSGCSTLPPLGTVEHVDVPRFMGQWYVVAAIPTLLERNAHNAIESYRLDDDGTIATTFTFRRGGFDGPLKTYRPRGYLQSDSNAVWGMQFLWPFKADYRVIYLADDYSATIIGRQRRDYVWIMARQPTLPNHELDALIEWVGTVGYDTADIVRIPQQDNPTQAVAELTRWVR